MLKKEERWVPFFLVWLFFFITTCKECSVARNSARVHSVWPAFTRTHARTYATRVENFLVTIRRSISTILDVTLFLVKWRHLQNVTLNRRFQGMWIFLWKFWKLISRNFKMWDRERPIQRKDAALNYDGKISHFSHDIFLKTVKQIESYRLYH